MFLIVSAVSLLFAMVLAGIYAVGEFAQQYWLLIPQMARLHGMANALGFSLGGLWGWTLAQLRAPEELSAAQPLR
jgi:YndJ-like protein